MKIYVISWIRAIVLWCELWMMPCYANEPVYSNLHKIIAGEFHYGKITLWTDSCTIKVQCITICEERISINEFNVQSTMVRKCGDYYNGNHCVAQPLKEQRQNVSCRCKFVKYVRCGRNYLKSNGCSSNAYYNTAGGVVKSVCNTETTA